MTNTINRLISFSLSILLLTPNMAFGATDTNKHQTEVAKLITSAEQPADGGGSLELTVGIVGAIVSSKEARPLSKLAETGKSHAIKEFIEEFDKWHNLIPEDPKAKQIAFKNAREILLAKYQRELDALWPRRYMLTDSERQTRVLLESKKYVMENIQLIKNKRVVINHALDNPNLVSRLSMEIIGREYVEKASLHIAQSIDITGKYGCMGHSIKSVRETVVYLLNDMVATADGSVSAPTMDARLAQLASFERTGKMLADAVGSKSGECYLFEFTRRLSRAVYKRTPLAIAGGAVVGIGLLFVSSANASAAAISNSRLVITRELNATLKNTPNLLAAKVIVLKNIYGTAAVASIISENGATMLPLLQEQFAAMQRPEVKEYAEYLLGKNSKSAAIASAKELAVKKAQLITAVRDNTFVRSFNERMQPLKLK